MLKKIYMQADDGRLSAGHVYDVSGREAKRLLRTRTQIQVMEGRRKRTRPGPLAVIATAEHLGRKKTSPEPSPLVLVKMSRQVGRFAPGRTYGFSATLAKRYCEGYKSGGRAFQPVGVRVEPQKVAPAKPLPFSPEGVKGISRRMLKDLADLGIETANHIHAARISDLTAVTGLGPAIATRLKKLAAEHAE